MSDQAPDAIPAITICQPWAWAIMSGPKRYENRPWSTYYVGPLVIHAGKSRKLLTPGLRALARLGVTCPPSSTLPFGAILGVVDMVDCIRPASAGGDPFAEGPFCHVYERPRLLEKPIPYRGQLGHFQVPRELVAALLE